MTDEQKSALGLGYIRGLSGANQLTAYALSDLAEFADYWTRRFKLIQRVAEGI